MTYQEADRAIRKLGYRSDIWQFTKEIPLRLPSCEGRWLTARAYPYASPHGGHRVMIYEPVDWDWYTLRYGFAPGLAAKQEGEAIVGRMNQASVDEAEIGSVLDFCP